MISILENYAESNPDAAVWIRPLLKKLRKYNEEGNDEKRN